MSDKLKALVGEIEETVEDAGGEFEFFDGTAIRGGKNPAFSLKIGMYPWGVTLVEGSEQEILEQVEDVAKDIESDIEHLKDELDTEETPRCPSCGYILKRCPDCGSPFCRTCDNHTYREVNSTEIAKAVSSAELDADEKALKFGKAFHEAYQEVCYRSGGYLDIDGPDEWEDPFSREIEGRLRDEEIYDEDLVARAIRIYEAMVKEGLVGDGIPKTVHRVRRGVVVYAKADLRAHPIIELKTGPLNDHARTQAKVQAWAYNTPVKLSGVNDDSDEQIALEVEIVEPDPSPVDAYMTDSFVQSTDPTSEA